MRFKMRSFRIQLALQKKTTKDESTPKMEICSNGMDRNLSNNHARTIISWKTHQTLAFAVDYVNYDLNFGSNYGVCIVAFAPKSFGEMVNEIILKRRV